jgi:hypothetical protein
MNRSLIVAVVAVATAVAAAPWVVGWRTEQLVRARGSASSIATARRW